jgi:hypothetical protein
MAARNPLVVIAGQLQELPVGDTLAGAGGVGPAGPVRSEVVYFVVPYTTRKYIDIDVPLATLAITDTVLGASLINVADSDENDLDDIVEIRVSARAGAGFVSVVMRSDGVFGGKFALGMAVA